MNPPRIAVLAHEFALGGPTQQILDRLARGWVGDGRVHPPPSCALRIHVAGTEAPSLLLERRQRFGWELATSPDVVAGGADGLLVLSQGVPDATRTAAIGQAIAACPEGCPVAFHGPWGADIAALERLDAVIRRRRLRVWTTHADAFLQPLPEREVFAEPTAFREGLLVAPLTAEQGLNEALGAWLPRIGLRPGAGLPVRRVRRWVGTGAWAARADWPQDLLAAAISRSDNPMADSDREGRVEDLVGLGLVPGMTQQIEVWQLEHADRFRSTLVLQSGILKDICLAARTASGRVVSGQLFRPGAPQAFPFNACVDALWRFLGGRGVVPSPDPGLAWSRLLALAGSPALRSGHWMTA